MNNVAHLQENSGSHSSDREKTPLEQKLVVLTQKEHIGLKWQGRFWKTQHARAIKRENALIQELQQAKAEIVNLTSSVSMARKARRQLVEILVAPTNNLSRASV